MQLAASLPATIAPPITAPYLVVDRVDKDFGTFKALNDISLAVPQGEFVAFLGPSGCGKTTLLRAIAGLDPATRGRILQGGVDITGLPPASRDFGIVFQSYALFPNLSVSENIGYGLRGAAWPRARRRDRVSELLTLVGLTEQARKYPAQISGGQQQRVALARALAAEPGLLLLDEPLSALDAIVRLHLRTEIRALQRRLGVTTIMVTHDQEEAMSVSDRIVVMSRGRIEQVGPPEEIYHRPATAFVASFVGQSSAFDGITDPAGAVIAKGQRVAAEAARRFPANTPVRVFIRPEDVRIGSAASGHPAALSAIVTGIEFRGPVCRLAVQVGALTVEAHSSLETLQREGASEGRSIAFVAPPERVLVFPVDA